MLSAAVCGQIFTSPTPDQIYAAIKAVNQGQGVFLVVKLVAITQSNSENDKQNLVTFDKVSNFKFKFRAPIKAGEKAVKYIYTTQRWK